jgi:hypothetical protein
VSLTTMRRAHVSLKLRCCNPKQPTPTSKVKPAFGPAFVSVYRDIMTWLFGILGAIAAVMYWRYTVSADPAFLRAAWSTVVFDGLIYATAGFVVGWIVGFALRRIGPD